MSLNYAVRVKVILALVLVAAAIVVALYSPRSNMRELSPEDLVLALKDRDGFVRGKAVEELIRRHDPQAVPRLVELLKDPAEDVRWIAARTLSEAGDTQAGEALISALSDPAEVVAREAATARR